MFVNMFPKGAEHGCRGAVGHHCGFAAGAVKCCFDTRLSNVFWAAEVCDGWCRPLGDCGISELFTESSGLLVG